MRLPPNEQQHPTAFGRLMMPAEAIEPILGGPVRAALLEWLTEIFAEDELKAVGVEPRRRALFDGPPGVGKTTLAHHLAARLGLPLLAARPDQLIDKWLGSTGRNIGAMFSAVEQGLSVDGQEAPVPIVLFLDEFDAIARTRRKSEQGSDDERNATVDILLQRIEQHPGFIIAATNHGGEIDPAIWRRFDMHITLELPRQGERRLILERYLKPFGLPAEPLSLLAEAFQSASPALIRQFCENLKRRIVLGPKLGHDMSKRAVIDRIIASVSPHPEIGKPPLWATAENDRARDRAIEALPWPLPTAGEAAKAKKKPKSRKPEAEGNVVDLGAARKRSAH